MEFQIDPSNGSGNKAGKGNSKKIMLGVIALLLIILIGAGVWFAITLEANKKALEAEKLARQQVELDRDQAIMNHDFEALSDQFDAFESQTKMIRNDSLRQDITEKYKAAKQRMEKLEKEMNTMKSQHNRDAAEIQKLKGEIESLRAILRTYVDQINQLNEENKTLRSENKEIKEENTRLNTQVEETTKQNEHLNERMTLAEKLNVTGVSFTALNKKGKTEKKVEKATQLVTTFTIPQNNSTPVGEKVIYMRIVSPSGQVLGSGGTFSFEGSKVQYTARKAVEYSGDEISNIRIYWDVNTALSPGAYTVELFTGNYRLASRSFQLK